MNIRAVTYARYSTDLQSDASIEDQVRLCEMRAKGDGATVLQTYADHGISGASTTLRPGVQAMIQDAMTQEFDVLYAEALDRLSRDQEDIAAIYKRLSFAGVRIVTLAEGEVSELHIGLKGTMNALFLKDLAQKVRRGLRGRVEAGRSGGGNAYGYDVVRADEERGKRTINAAQAAVVRRIFADYVAGKSPKKIAQALNAEAVPGPSGKGWGASTLYGNRDRGTGILNNEIYIGRLVWNRLRYVKDPATGKRVSRLNPQKDWIVQEVPDMRLIEQSLWDAVKTRQGAHNKHKKAFWKARRPRNLFSYLIKCGSCGGGCSLLGARQIGCSNARNKGTCDNRLTISRNFLEEDILGALRGQLMDPELTAIFCKEYTEHLNRLRRGKIDAATSHRKELAKLERERGRLVESIKGGVPADLVRDEAERISARIEVVTAALDGADEPAPILHPAMATRYADEVQRLIETLNADSSRDEAADIIRSLIDRIVLTPDKAGRCLVVDLEGDLAGILTVAGSANGAAPSSADLDEIIAGNRIELLHRQSGIPVGKAGCGRGTSPIPTRVVGIDGSGGSIPTILAPPHPSSGLVRQC